MHRQDDQTRLPYGKLDGVDRPPPLKVQGRTVLAS